jgi:hypothetical protein
VLWGKLDLEHGLAASAALASFSGTVWIAAGVWLSHADINSLNNLPNKSPKLNSMIKTLFKDADHQLALGMVALLFGLIAQLLSVAAAVFHW